MLYVLACTLLLQTTTHTRVRRRSIGILETVLSIVGKAGEAELEAELELAVRSNQILEHLVSTPEVCAKVGGSDSGSAAINGLFWFLFSGPKMVDVKDIKNEGVIAIDSRMLGAHTLALIVDGAGEEGTAKVLDGCDSLFEKISDDGNTDELQVHSHPFSIYIYPSLCYTRTDTHLPHPRHWYPVGCHSEAFRQAGVPSLGQATHRDADRSRGARTPHRRFVARAQRL